MRQTLKIIKIPDKDVATATYSISLLCFVWLFATLAMMETNNEFSSSVFFFLVLVLTYLGEFLISIHTLEIVRYLEIMYMPLSLESTIVVVVRYFKIIFFTLCFVMCRTF